MRHHDLTARQKGYARYLLKLTAGSRNDRLASMKPSLRQKMRDYMVEAQASRIADWDEQVRGMYLRKLHRDNSAEFEKLLGFVSAETANDYRRAIALH
ncbi:MAG: hypothetical protein VX474_02715 [Pseudomonadota bacterium]|nr:hypothetical protein [Pseudomonadota bacterium]MEE2748860.1 hypothetical protein [Pseudomonadota bacterium]